MTNMNFIGLSKLGAIMIFSAAAVGMSACSTTSSSMMSQGAPITYKIDQGASQQTSITSPSRAISSTPRAVRDMSRPNARAHTSLTKNSVDKKLHAHQRVGKPYTIFGKRYTPKHQPNYDVTGTASWYGPKFNGKPTATGEIYDMYDITAAHKTLPLNSMVVVTNIKTGKYLNVRVNDRGPFVGDRIIDLSKAAANELGLFTSGLGEVRVQYAGPADPMAPELSAKRRKQSPAMQAELPKALLNAIPRALPKKFEPLLEAIPAPKSADLSPNYKPLRDLGAPPATNVSLQQQQQRRFSFEPQGNKSQPRNLIPQPKPSNQMGEAPQNAQTQVPESKPVTGNIQDGPITLTIKGPVHMASIKSESDAAQPKFIPAVNYTTIPANK